MGHSTGDQIKRFTSVLLEKGLLSQDQLEIAEKEKQIKGLSLEEIVIHLGFMSESALAEAISLTTGVDKVELGKVLIDPGLQRLIPRPVAEKFSCLPLSFEAGVLKIATPDVHNLTALDAVKNSHSDIQTVVPLIASESELIEALDGYYGYDLSICGLLKEIEDVSQSTLTRDDFANPTIRLVNAILMDAIKKGTSDIHFEPEGAFMRIRYRIDGLLFQMSTLHASYWPAICVRLKVMAELNIAEPRRPQNGRISFYLGPREIDLRVGTHPTIHGENIVVRILDKSRSLLSLDELGYSQKVIDLIKKALKKPEGIFIITGPTGCGKTTSLYSILNHINKPELNIMTLEEPVEYQLPLIRQSTIKPQFGMDFSEGVKSILRQDPDMILIGEIRDTSTAQMALRAAMTGHQVFSTLHTSDALGAIPRLIDLGLTKPMLYGNVLAFVAQRLVRRLCLNCKQKAFMGLHEAKLLNLNKPQHFFIPKGCEDCRFTGFKGRLALAEILIFDPELDEIFLKTNSNQILKSYALKKGYIPMKGDAKLRVLKGDTSLEEVLRVIDIREGP